MSEKTDSRESRAGRSRLISERVAEAVRALLSSRKFSAMALADRMGVKRETVYQYRDAKGLPRFDAMAQLADLAGVSLDWLAGLVGTRERERDSVVRAARVIRERALQESGDGVKPYIEKRLDTLARRMVKNEVRMATREAERIAALTNQRAADAERDIRLSVRNNSSLLATERAVRTRKRVREILGEHAERFMRTPHEALGYQTPDYRCQASLRDRHFVVRLAVDLAHRLSPD